MVFGERRSGVGFELTDLGECSVEGRAVWRGEGELGSTFAEPSLPSLLTLGVAGVLLLLDESDMLDLDLDGSIASVVMRRE